MLFRSSASTITLGQTSYSAGFYLQAGNATLVNMSVVSVSNPSIVNPVYSFLMDAGFSGSFNPTVNLNSYTTSNLRGYINTYGTGSSTINMNAFSSFQDLDLYGPQTQSLNSYANGIITSSTIRTLTVPIYRALQNVGTQFNNMSALWNLTIGDVRADLTPGSFFGTSVFRNLTATSSVASVLIALTGETALQSVSTAGILNELVLNGNSSLTSVATAGQRCVTD